MTYIVSSGALNSTHSPQHLLKPKFHLARLDTFDVSSPFILALSSLSNSTARHDELDRRDSQLILLCNVFQIMICNLFTNYWSIQLFILFNLTEQIGFVYENSTND